MLCGWYHHRWAAVAAAAGFAIEVAAADAWAPPLWAKHMQNIMTIALAVLAAVSMKIQSIFSYITLRIGSPAPYHAFVCRIFFVRHVVSSCPSETKHRFHSLNVSFSNPFHLEEASLPCRTSSISHSITHPTTHSRSIPKQAFTHATKQSSKEVKQAFNHRAFSDIALHQLRAQVGLVNRSRDDASSKHDTMCGPPCLRFSCRGSRLSALPCRTSTSEHISERMPENMSEKMSDRMSEDMSERMSENVSE